MSAYPPARGNLRRPPPGYSDRGSGRSNRTNLLLAAAGLVVLIIVLFVAVRACGGDDGCDLESNGVNFRCVEIQVPQGFLALTPVYQLEAEADPAGPATITLRLEDEVAEDANLGFYSIEGGNARLVAPVELSADGESVTGQLDALPATLVVLSRQGGGPAVSGGQVFGYVPRGGQLDAEAASLLTVVHPMDYFPAPDGTVQGSSSISPVEEGFLVYPTILATAENGAAGAVETILQTAESRTAHVNAIVNLVNSEGYPGVDIAYLDLRPESASLFTIFIVELANAVHAADRQLTLTLPLPARGGADFSTGAYDWANLAKVADYLKVLPERDQSVYRTRMPEALQFLSGLVGDPTKLVLVVSPYAAERSAEGIRTMTVVDAMALASLVQPKDPNLPITINSRVALVAPNISRENGSFPPAWSEETATVTFSYSSRTVWIENAFSMGFKLELVNRFRLGGFAVEDASDNENLGDFWGSVATFVETGTPLLMRPNAEVLTPRWDRTGGELEGGSQGEVTWSTPASPGQYEITLTLSDGVSRFTRSTTFDVVQEGAPPTIPDEGDGEAEGDGPIG